MKLNQSFIKRLSKPYCPKKVKAEIDGLHKRKASEAMIKGQYFEYKLFNTKNREGQIPEIPLLKNGKMSTDQIRIDQQVETFFKVCDKEGIKFFGTDRTFHLNMFGHETFGTWDGYGLLKRRKPLVIDIKLTADITNDYGDFCWADFASMDKIQAETYMLSGRKMDLVDYDFLFMVFDYKKKPEHVLHYVTFNQETEMRVQTRLDETQAKIDLHTSQNWPAVGIPDECKDCVFSDSCALFVTKQGKKDQWKAKQQAKVVAAEEIVEAQKELDDLLSGVFEDEFTF